MKTNTTKKVIVATMAIAMGASIVGSISGTAAWYQYSTRATAEYSGAAGACTEDLLISNAVDGTFANAINLGGTDSVLRPVSSGALALDKAPTSLYKNPMYQVTEPSKWGLATTSDYYQFDVYAKVKNVDGGTTETYFANKNIYLTDVTFAAEEVTGKQDLSEALRVVVLDGAGNEFATYSKSDYSTTGLNVYGPLDLGGPVGNDTNKKYSWESGTFDELVYGVEGSNTAPVAYSYSGHDKATANTSHKVADDSDPAHIKGAALATTGTNGAAVKVCTVRIYLEGWEPLGAENAKSSLWDLGKTIGAKFNVGLRFSTTPVGDETNGQQQPSQNP